MKKAANILLTAALVLTFGLFALGSGESTETSQGSGSVNSDTSSGSTQAEDQTKLGNYQVDMKSCRLAEDYQGKKVVIVTYGFTNNGKESAAFYTAIEDKVYQNGVGLNKAYVLADSAEYSADNQTKSLQNGASLDIEVAYELNDETTDISVEVSELFSLSGKKLTKTFSIA